MGNVNFSKRKEDATNDFYGDLYDEVGQWAKTPKDFAKAVWFEGLDGEIEKIDE